MAFGNPMSMRWCRLYKGTPAELALEDAVAALGVPYRTNFPGFLYGARSFPDFYLPTLDLVIEVDDPSHAKPEKQEADEIRTETLGRLWNVRVVRCTNKDALSDPRGTVRAMLKSVDLWPIPEALPRLAASMPTPKKAPRRERRAAKSAARKRARTVRATRRGSAGTRRGADRRSSRSPASSPSNLQSTATQVPLHQLAQTQ